MSEEGRRRLAVRVTRDAERQVRAGHPWVFDRSVTSVTPPDGAEAGDLGVVFDHARRFLAVGLWDPSSPIRLRLLHRGRPRSIDGTFFAERVGAAADLRAPLAASGGTTGYRVVHGEGDGLPGLVVDRYEDVLVVKLYTAAWGPHLGAVVAALRDRFDPAAVVLRLARDVARAGVPGLVEGRALHGVAPVRPVPFLEAGLAFAADVVHGQKTGWFLDQRENRALASAMARGASVLDVFCAGGGFTVHAAAGAAATVTSVDASPAAVAAVSANLAANAGRRAVAACRHEGIVGDAYEVLAGLHRRRRRFDLVIVDPPSFASKQDQVEGALAAYGRLPRAALDLVAPGGALLQASCSARVTAERFHAAVLGAARRAVPSIVQEARTGQPVDHPTLPTFPEGPYLKAVVLRRPPTA